MTEPVVAHEEVIRGRTWTLRYYDGRQQPYTVVSRRGLGRTYTHQFCSTFNDAMNWIGRRAKNGELA